MKARLQDSQPFSLSVLIHFYREAWYNGNIMLYNYGYR